jgi:hypothetical protein
MITDPLKKILEVDLKQRWSRQAQCLNKNVGSDYKNEAPGDNCIDNNPVGSSIITYSSI